MTQPIANKKPAALKIKPLSKRLGPGVGAVANLARRAARRAKDSLRRGQAIKPAGKPRHPIGSLTGRPMAIGKPQLAQEGIAPQLLSPAVRRVRRRMLPGGEVLEEEYAPTRNGKGQIVLSVTGSRLLPAGTRTFNLQADGKALKDLFLVRRYQANNGHLSDFINFLQQFGEAAVEPLLGVLMEKVDRLREESSESKVQSIEEMAQLISDQIKKRVETANRRARDFVKKRGNTLSMEEWSQAFLDQSLRELAVEMFGEMMPALIKYGQEKQEEAALAQGHQVQLHQHTEALPAMTQSPEFLRSLLDHELNREEELWQAIVGKGDSRTGNLQPGIEFQLRQANGEYITTTYKAQLEKQTRKLKHHLVSLCLEKEREMQRFHATYYRLYDQVRTTRVVPSEISEPQMKMIRAFFEGYDQRRAQLEREVFDEESKKIPERVKRNILAFGRFPQQLDPRRRSHHFAWIGLIRNPLRRQTARNLSQDLLRSSLTPQERVEKQRQLSDIQRDWYEVGASAQLPTAIFLGEQLHEGIQKWRKRLKDLSGVELFLKQAGVDLGPEFAAKLRNRCSVGSAESPMKKTLERLQTLMEGLQAELPAGISRQDFESALFEVLGESVFRYLSGVGGKAINAVQRRQILRRFKLCGSHRKVTCLVSLLTLFGEKDFFNGLKENVFEKLNEKRQSLLQKTPDAVFQQVMSHLGSTREGQAFLGRLGEQLRFAPETSKLELMEMVQVVVEGEILALKDRERETVDGFVRNLLGTYASSRRGALDQRIQSVKKIYAIKKRKFEDKFLSEFQFQLKESDVAFHSQLAKKISQLADTYPRRASLLLRFMMAKFGDFSVAEGQKMKPSELIPVFLQRLEIQFESEKNRQSSEELAFENYWRQWAAEMEAIQRKWTQKILTGKGIVLPEETYFDMLDNYRKHSPEIAQFVAMQCDGNRIKSFKLFPSTHPVIKDFHSYQMPQEVAAEIEADCRENGWVMFLSSHSHPYDTIPSRADGQFIRGRILVDDSFEPYQKPEHQYPELASLIVGLTGNGRQPTTVLNPYRLRQIASGADLGARLQAAELMPLYAIDATGNRYGGVGKSRTYDVIGKVRNDENIHPLMADLWQVLLNTEINRGDFPAEIQKLKSTRFRQHPQMAG